MIQRKRAFVGIITNTKSVNLGIAADFCTTTQTLYQQKHQKTVPTIRRGPESLIH
jgi:hypothetical protein